MALRVFGRRRRLPGVVDVLAKIAVVALHEAVQFGNALAHSGCVGLAVVAKLGHFDKGLLLVFLKAVRLLGAKAQFLERFDTHV